MGHITATDDQEPDYVFVVNKGRSDVLLNQLKNGFLDFDRCVKIF